MRAQVAFIASSLDAAYKFQRVLSNIGADVSARSTAQLGSIMKPGNVFDLVIFEAIGGALAYMDAVRSTVEGQGIPLLAIVEEDGLATLGLPDQVPSDFVLAGAGPAECEARVARLLGQNARNGGDDAITVDEMVINLNTYQVTVGGEPVDLTYLEYALLAFLARHPSRAFTRDVLLQSVWGFDYLGGSRTVDVHVRRIRAKLGPKLALHLETVRGVGYLWNPRDRRMSFGSDDANGI